MKWITSHTMYDNRKSFRTVHFSTCVPPQKDKQPYLLLFAVLSIIFFLPLKSAPKMYPPSLGPTLPICKLCDEDLETDIN